MNPQAVIQMLSSTLGRRCDCACLLSSHSELEPFPCQVCDRCQGYTEGGELPPELPPLASQLIVIYRQFAPLLSALGVELPAELPRELPPFGAPAPGLVPVAYVAVMKARPHLHNWKRTARGQDLNFEKSVCDECSAICQKSKVVDLLIYQSPRTYPREVYILRES